MDRIPVFSMDVGRDSGLPKTTISSERAKLSSFLTRSLRSDSGPQEGRGGRNIGDFLSLFFALPFYFGWKSGETDEIHFCLGILTFISD